MRTFAAVIDSFGGAGGFAKALGIPGSHARAMKARDSIPREYWHDIAAAARSRSIDGITLELLAEIAARYAGRVA